MRRDPQLYDEPQSRWRLASIRRQLHAFAQATLATISHTLKRLRICYKRSRSYIHSPDPLYADKRTYIEQLKAEVRAHPEHKVLLFLDEYSAYRQPKNGRAYAAKGCDQPLARRSLQSERRIRVLGALNFLNGQVSYRITTRTDADCFRTFWRQLVATYPDKELYVVLDNWPMHFHPEVLEELVEQQSPFAFAVSRSWQPLVADGRQPRTGNLPIQLVPLPTYASWLNPIEKLWLRLGETKLILHRKADDFAGLRTAIADYLDAFQSGSLALLHAVGLLPAPPPNVRSIC